MGVFTDDIDTYIHTYIHIYIHTLFCHVSLNSQDLTGFHEGIISFLQAGITIRSLHLHVTKTNTVKFSDTYPNLAFKYFNLF